MKPDSVVRIAKGFLKKGGARTIVWAARDQLRNARALSQADKREFARFVIRDHARYTLGRHPAGRRTSAEAAHAAVEWLLRAQERSPDDGVSYGYFPLPPHDGWRASYPETTGYIITSLIAYAKQFDAPHVEGRAHAMAHWEVDVQMESGAVQGGEVCAPEEQTPAAFNTGMVLDGLISSLEARNNPVIEQAARRAADFLTNDLDDRGFFKTNGAFVSAEKVKLYNCLCGWAMIRAARVLGEESYWSGAIKAAEAALSEQTSSGYFRHNCLGHPERPLTHTIGYTLQGLLEVGLEAGREDFVDAAVRGTRPMLDLIGDDGFLHGRFFEDWSPGLFSSCLTGSAQVAIVAFRISEVTGEERFADGASRLVRFLKGVQETGPDLDGTRGGIPGAYPILGHYLPAGYPNWATKYFLDALLLDHRYSAGRNEISK